MNKHIFIFITSSDIRTIYNNLHISTSLINSLKNFFFVFIVTLISVIAYVFGSLIEISIGARSLANLWSQFEIWHILGLVIILLIATSHSLNKLKFFKWIKGIIILVPIPLFMWMPDFWGLGIVEKSLFSWAIVVAFVSIFYLLTSGLKSVDAFLAEALDSDIGLGRKIIRHCKKNNQKIIYTGNVSNSLDILKNAALKENSPEMVIDINTISSGISFTKENSFSFEDNCKVHSVLYEIYKKGLLRQFQSLNELVLKADSKKADQNNSENIIEACYIHKSSNINNVKIPIATSAFLRNNCCSENKNALHSASLIYALFFNSSAKSDEEIVYCNKKELDNFYEKIIRQFPDKHIKLDSFEYSGVLSGLWDIKTALKNDAGGISEKSIKALCYLQEKEIFWPIMSYIFDNDDFLSRLIKLIDNTNSNLTLNDILGVCDIMFNLGSYAQAKHLIESTLSTYDFSWKYKSLLLKVNQRLISTNSSKEADANKKYFDLFMSEYNNMQGFDDEQIANTETLDYLDFINILVWTGTRIKKDQALFDKITPPIQQLFKQTNKILRSSDADGIPPNKLWHFLNNSANFHERLFELNKNNHRDLEKSINYYYKSIYVRKADIKWIGGSLINYANLMSLEISKNTIIDKNISLKNGYSCDEKDILRLAELSLKYKAQIYDLDEISYPREFIARFQKNTVAYFK